MSISLAINIYWVVAMTTKDIKTRTQELLKYLEVRAPEFEYYDDNAYLSGEPIYYQLAIVAKRNDKACLLHVSPTLSDREIKKKSLEYILEQWEKANGNKQD